MPGPVRDYFEPRFGHAFDGVRLHDDPAAHDTAKAINARAFTIGRDIVFGEGQYSPDNVEGRRLLAHELTHVVQQQAHADYRIQRTITIADAANTTPPHSRNNGALAVSLFNQLCPDITWHLNNDTIEAVNTNDCDAAAVQQGNTPTACKCICDFTKTTGPHAEIQFNQTDDNTVSTGQNSYRIRLTGQAAQGIRGIQGVAPSTGSPLRTISDPPWVILGHELCGHALTTYPLNATSPASLFHQMSQDWNMTAVDIENRIRQEHNIAYSAGLGMRVGEFQDVDGDIHAGSLIQLPQAMSLADLLNELAVPVRYKYLRCVRQDYFYPCTTIPSAEADMRNVKIVNRVMITNNGNQAVPWSCRNNVFPQGTYFNIEGVFWHRAAGGDTKQGIAGQWGVSISALNRANSLFGNGIDTIPDSQILSTGSMVVIPYKSAPGSTRYFLTVTNQPC